MKKPAAAITRAIVVVIVAIVAIASLSCQPCNAENVGFPGGDPDRFRAMSMNVYLGADLARLATYATDPNDPCLVAYDGEFLLAGPCVTAELWSDFLASDFPSRAAVLAGHIASSTPDVVGLQEVATAYTGNYDTSVISSGVPMADQVEQDFLAELLNRLEERVGRKAYVAIPGNVVSDSESPVYVDPYDTSKGLLNVRIQTRNVLLVNTETCTWDDDSVELVAFESQVSIGFLQNSYGFVAADVTVRGRTTYRVANAHLATADTGSVQTDQARELVELLSDGSEEALPVILMADINSYPEHGDKSDIPVPYQIITEEGKYTDMWTINENPDADDGLTFGHTATLTNEEVNFSLRIDYVFYKGEEKRKAWMRTYGKDPLDSRTADGLWGSDHAAVFLDCIPATDTDDGGVPTIDSTPSTTDGSDAERSIRYRISASGAVGTICAVLFLLLN